MTKCLATSRDFVSCTVIGWTLFQYSIMSSFRFKFPTVRSPDKYAICTSQKSTQFEEAKDPIFIKFEQVEAEQYS